MNHLVSSLPSERQRLVSKRLLKFSCVIPVHNEEENITSFLTQLYKELEGFSREIQILVIDDGSTDRTRDFILEMMKHIPIKLLTFSRNFGKEQAIAAGVSHATGDVTLIIDADFQHPFSLIKTFVEKWHEGYDMVYGIRQNREHDSILKRGFTKLFYKLLSFGANVAIPPNAGDFRLIDRKGIEALKQCHERSRFTKGLYAWVGFRSIGVPFKVTPRKRGQSSWSFFRLGELALTGIFSFSNAPLRVWAVTGLFIAAVAFGYGSYIVYDTLVYGIDVPGYATLIVSIMFLGGIQLFSIGILGEYIALIFTEVKARPSYIFSEIIESPLLTKDNHHDPKHSSSKTH